MAQQMTATVFKLDNGRWTWDVVAGGGTVLAEGRDYDRPSRAVDAARRVTGLTPVVAEGVTGTRA